MSLNKRVALALVLSAGAICVLIASGALNDVLAQTGPLGVPRPSTPGTPPPDGFTGWLLAKQAEYYRAMSGAIRGAKTDNTALLALFGLAFAYGIFHAAGPGHGKAVISSYLVANEETWRRGIILSFASAFLQALVAVLIVGIAAALLGATAKVMGEAVRYIEIISYALIAALGARLLWVKGKGFIAALRGAPAGHDHGHSHAVMRTIMRMTTRTIITITTMLIRMMPAMCTTRIAGIRMDRSPISSPVPAAGSAA